MQQVVGNAREDAEPRPDGLLQLPKELQLIIWEFTLIEPDTVPFFTRKTTEDTRLDDTSGTKGLRWNIPSLLQVCRSCRVEGTPIFYSNNLFVLRHERSLTDFDAIRALLERFEGYLSMVGDFGLEFEVSPSTMALLRGHKALDDRVYAFQFTSDAAPSHQRPLTAVQKAETDICFCHINASNHMRQYQTLSNCTRAMIGFLASFGAQLSQCELRVTRDCGRCEKKMLEQRTRQPEELGLNN